MDTPDLHSLKEIISISEDENHVLRQKTSNATPRSIQSGFAKSLSDESTTPSKTIGLVSQGLSGSRHAEFSFDEHQDNYKILSRCIKQKLGFLEGKPVAAAFIYRCLIHWHSFEVERTAILDFIIESINDVLKVGNENGTLPYWLTNTSALLCLVQRNLCSDGSMNADSQRSAGSGGLNGRFNHGLKTPLKHLGLEDGLSHVEVKYPAITFQQQLTACLEKIFALIRDNFKKEVSPVLHLCIEATRSRVHVGKLSRSPGAVSNSHWDNIIKFLDSLMSRFRENHVPSFFIRKLIAQVFSFINLSLFNSMLLRRECCSFSSGEYLKSGLAELKSWIVKSKDEFAGTSWHELNHFRQAVIFLVIHEKRNFSLRKITQDLCPALTIKQIYRISTMYWDDKYGTRSVSNEVLAEMRETFIEDSTSTFLLDEDLSIPFSREDIFMELSAIESQMCNFPTS